MKDVSIFKRTDHDDGTVTYSGLIVIALALWVAAMAIVAMAWAVAWAVVSLVGVAAWFASQLPGVR